MQLEEIKEYYRHNGKLWQHYFIDKQKRMQGKYIWYFSNGIFISREANFKDDKYHGKRISYNLDGTINYIEYHWHGKEITKSEFLKLKLESIQ